MNLEDLKEPTPAEVRGWLDQSVGKYFLAYLHSEIKELQDDWANGDFTGEVAEITIQRNSEALGKVQQTANVLLKLEEMSTDDEPTEDTED